MNNLAQSLIIATLATFIQSMNAQEIPPAVLWQVPLRGQDVAVGPDGHPVVIAPEDGETSFVVTKIDGQSGATIWEIRLDYGDYDPAKGIAVGTDGNPVVTGSIQIVKLNGTTGGVLWNASFEGGLSDYAAAVAIGLDGDPIVAGTTETEDSTDFRIIKYDGTSGAVIWNVTFENGTEDYAEAVAIGTDGHPVVAGPSDGILVLKCDGLTGDILWSTIAEENTDGGHGVAIGPDGNPVITGEANALLTVKLDGGTGAVLWRHEAIYDIGGDVVVGADGNPVVAGAHIVKYDGATGEILWILTSNNAGPWYQRGIAIGPDGKLITTGPVATVKFGGPTRSILWVKSATHLFSSEDALGYVAIGSDGNPVVTGAPYNDGGNGDFRTVKYHGATGQVLWDVTYDGGGTDYPTSVAVGRDGNTFVAGSSEGHFRIIKYEGETGALLWSVVFDSGTDDYYGSVAVGTDGNPVLAGNSGNDITLVRFDAGTGAVLWNTVFSSGLQEFVAGVAVGLDNNPVVATSLGDGFENSDFHTIKFDGTTGAVLWDVVFDSGVADAARGIAIAPDGNPVVTGVHQNQLNYPFYINTLRTIKYDTSTGASLWNVTSAGELSQGDGYGVGGVAIGADGNPVVVADFVDDDGTGNNPITRTIRYDGVTGAVLSNQAFNTEDPDHPAVAIGPDGNPVIAVTSYVGGGVESSVWIIKYLTQVETAAGTDVGVHLNNGAITSGGVTVEFSQVTAAGATTMFTSNAGEPLPSGFTLGTPPTYYELSTTATIAGSVTVCIAYDPSQFTDPNNLRLLHFENNAWADVTIANNTTNHFICGNVSSLSPFVIAQRAANRPPVADAGSAQVVSAGADCQATVSLNGSGSSDPDGDTLTFTWTGSFGSANGPLPTVTLPLGQHTVTLTVADGKGGTSAAGVSVTVKDTTAPVLTCPANMTIPCSIYALVPVTFSVSASDNCDSSPTVTSTPFSGSGFPTGTTTVACLATDVSGNTSTCTFTVTRAPLGFNGFLPPIGGADAAGGSFVNPVRTFKMNSTIPVKFAASCAGIAVLSGIHTLQAIKYTDATTADPAIDATPQDAASTGNQFRLTDGQWHFNLDTKGTGMSVGVWQLIAVLSDGSQHSVWIQIK